MTFTEEGTLLEPMTKERLSRFFSLKIQTENHLERITRLKSKAQFPEMRENDGSSRNPGAGDPMANTIVKRITYEEEISEQLEANLAEMELIPKRFCLWRTATSRNVCAVGT